MNKIFNRETLCIIRGLPGSGKSTLAQKMAKMHSCEHFEADMYFMNSQGNYNFNPKLLGRAHEWCLEEVQTRMRLGLDVIVSNTFTTIKELDDYMQLGWLYGYHVNVIECTANYGSIHNVPQASLDKMKARWVTNETLMKHYKIAFDLDRVSFEEYNEDEISIIQ